MLNASSINSEAKVVFFKFSRPAHTEATRLANRLISRLERSP